MLTMQMLLINLFLIVMFLLPIQQQVLINPIPIFDLLSLSCLVSLQTTNKQQITTNKLIKQINIHRMIHQSSITIHRIGQLFQQTTEGNQLILPPNHRMTLIIIQPAIHPPSPIHRVNRYTLQLTTK